VWVDRVSVIGQANSPPVIFEAQPGETANGPFAQLTIIPRPGDAVPLNYRILGMPNQNGYIALWNQSPLLPTFTLGASYGFQAGQTYTLHVEGSNDPFQ